MLIPMKSSKRIGRSYTPSPVIDLSNAAPIGGFTYTNQVRPSAVSVKSVEMSSRENSRTNPISKVAYSPREISILKPGVVSRIPPSKNTYSKQSMQSSTGSTTKSSSLNLSSGGTSKRSYVVSSQKSYGGSQEAYYTNRPPQKIQNAVQTIPGQTD